MRGLLTTLVSVFLLFSSPSTGTDGVNLDHAATGLSAFNSADSHIKRASAEPNKTRALNRHQSVAKSDGKFQRCDDRVKECVPIFVGEPAAISLLDLGLQPSAPIGIRVDLPELSISSEPIL
jgi:hypothetical protein